MPNHLGKNYIDNEYKIFATKKKIIVYFFIIVFCIFLVFNWVFYRLYSANIEQIVVKESKSTEIKTREFVDMILESMEYTADVLQNNNLIQQQIDYGDHSNSVSYRTNLDIINTIQSIVTNSAKSAASIDLYLNKTGKLYTSDYGVYSDLGWTYADYFMDLQQSEKRFVFTDEYRKKLTFISDRNYEQITFVRPLYVLSSGAKAGILAVNFNKYNLKNIVKGKSDSGSMILDKNKKTIISAFPDHYQYSHSQIEEFKKFVTEDSGQRICKVNGENFIIVYGTSQYSGWKFVTIVPAGASMQQMWQLRDYILLLFLLMNITSALVLTLLFSEKVYRKLKRLILSMKEVEKGNFNVNIQHFEKDEFGYMYKSFNNMVGRIKTLFTQLYEQKLLQKDAELKLLQSKINPHFIYNIFDNMNWLIQLGRYDELESLVESVSNYFKKSLNAGKDFITVADTLEQLKSYVEIQRIRFGSRFSCKLDFDEEIMDLTIPNFMLQPLLENAICHGIEPKAEESLIQVKGVKIDDRVFFTVEDNGVGISSDALQKIIGFLESEQGESDNYFALANINKRIKLYYGEEYGLVIKSSQGAGTKVTVIIPANPESISEGSLCLE
ncbi:MAG: sensor histidine kinase [Bacillota bacterium]